MFDAYICQQSGIEDLPTKTRTRVVRYMILTREFEKVEREKNAFSFQSESRKDSKLSFSAFILLPKSYRYSRSTRHTRPRLIVPIRCEKYHKPFAAIKLQVNFIFCKINPVQTKEKKSHDRHRNRSQH
jgi:hypothetical protein